MNAEMTDGDTQQDNVIDPIVSDVEMASQHGSDIDETASNVSIKSEYVPFFKLYQKARD